MAELTTVARSEVDYQAGRKAHPTELNRQRTAIIDAAAVYAAPAQNDTFATHLVLPAGSRIKAPVTVSNGTGTASSTLSVGLRDALTKVVVAADAIVLNCAITTAACVQVNTGTKLTAGQYYTLASDCEIYGTFTGAAGAANQAIRVEIDWISP